MSVTIVNGIITAAAGTAPDGSRTMTRFASTAANGCWRQILTVADDTSTYNAEVYFAKTAIPQIIEFGLGVSGGTAISSLSTIDLQTGQVTGGTAEVVGFGPCWRVSASVANNGTGNTAGYVHLALRSGGTGSCDFWSLQVTRAAAASPSRSVVSGPR